MCVWYCQVWDSLTGRLKKDLTYQAEDMFMMHEEAVLCLGFSRDSEMLVSGKWWIMKIGVQPASAL